MKSPCDLVAERLAVGDPLSADEQDHATRCVACARLAAMPRLIAAAVTEPEPAPGFSARMTARALDRLKERRRNRLIATTIAAAGVVLAGGFAIARPDHRLGDVGAMRALAELEPHPAPPPVAETSERAQRVALDLVRAADVDRSITGEAPWSDVTQPLVPYRALLAQPRVRKGAPR